MKWGLLALLLISLASIVIHGLVFGGDVAWSMIYGLLIASVLFLFGFLVVANRRIKSNQRFMDILIRNLPEAKTINVNVLYSCPEGKEDAEIIHSALTKRGWTIGRPIMPRLPKHESPVTIESNRRDLILEIGKAFHEVNVLTGASFAKGTMSDFVEITVNQRIEV